MITGQSESNLYARPVVVHVSSAHPWTDNRIHFRECVSLARAGYTVYLVAVEHEIAVESTEVTVIRLPKRRRLARATLGSFTAVVAGLRTRAQVFHLHDPELAWSVPVLRILGKTVIYDAHEDLPAQLLNKEYGTKFSRIWMSWAASLIVRMTQLAHHNVAATDQIASRYDARRTTIVHNYPPLRDAESSAGPPSGRAPRIVYVGNLSRARGAVEMISALSDPRFPQAWRLDLAGSIPRRLYDELTSMPGWVRTDFRGQIPPHSARDLLLNARVGVVVLQRNAAYLDSLPTKMFEYFAAGIPVIASDFPLWRSIIEKYECGLLVDETSPRNISEAVAIYDSDPDLLDLHARNARRAAESEFNWRLEETALLAAYDSALRHG